MLLYGTISNIYFSYSQIPWLLQSHEYLRTYQCNVQKVVFVPDVGEGGRDVGVEIIPPQTELFCPHPENENRSNNLLYHDI